MTKLLNKSVKSYILYAAVILLLSIPLLFVAIQHLATGNVDENLVKQKKIIVSRLNNKNEPYTLADIEHFEPNIRLQPQTPVNSRLDRFYSYSRRDTADQEDEPYRAFESSIVINGQPYNIQLSDSLLENEDLITGIVSIVFIILLFIVSGLILINRKLSAQVWKPFYNTIAKLNQYKIETDDALTFNSTSVTEFTDLNNAITSLTSRNQEMYLSQKAFIDNASHEMQTPLAVLRGKFDLLLQTPLQQEQYELIDEMLHVNHQLSNLHKNLLLLTKIENRQFTDTEDLSVSEIIRKLTDQYSFLVAENGIAIELENNGGDIIVYANRGLIEIMLGNLLSNAIRHNIKNGVVNIQLTGRTVHFINASHSGELQSAKLFQRFQKQSADNNNTGLGLHITKKIAEYYGFEVVYSFLHFQHRLSVHFHTVSQLKKDEPN